MARGGFQGEWWTCGPDWKPLLLGGAVVVLLGGGGAAVASAVTAVLWVAAGVAVVLVAVVAVVVVQLARARPADEEALTERGRLMAAEARRQAAAGQRPAITNNYVGGTHYHGAGGESVPRVVRGQIEED